MACSSCGKSRASQQVRQSRNAGTSAATRMAQPTTIKTVDSQAVQVNTAQSSSPNRIASTRTKV